VNAPLPPTFQSIGSLAESIARRTQTIHDLARLIQSIVINGTPISNTRGIRNQIARITTIEDDIERNFVPAWKRARSLMTGGKRGDSLHRKRVDLMIERLKKLEKRP